MDVGQNATAPDQKREKIISAAEELFIRNGFAATSMADVAAAARASKRTIYARFRTKEELFSAVMLAACRGIVAPRLDFGEDLTLKAALKAAGQATLYRVFQPRGIAVLGVAIGAKAHFPRIMEIYWENGPGVAQTFVKDAMIRERAAGRYRSVAPTAAASRFINFIFGPFLYGVLFADERLPSRKRMDEELNRSIKDFMAWIGEH